MPKAVFLMYHCIYSSEDDMSGMVEGDRVYGVHVDEFEWQIDYLKDNGYQILLLDEYFQKIHDNALPEKCAVITFDDGHISTYTAAYPILKEKGCAAEVFVATDLISGKSYMNWDHVRELNREGFSIQSHTASHPYLTDLSEGEIEVELRRSKELIESNLQRRCRYFCPPGGRYNVLVKRVARRAGYEAVCTSNVGYNDEKTDPMELRRFPIMVNTSREEFKQIIERDRKYVVRLCIRFQILKVLKMILGNAGYNYLREKAFLLKQQ